MVVQALPCAAQKPLDRMLTAFPDAHQKSNGWWAHDDNPRFDFIESPEGDIRLHSWTGRTPDDILAMGRIPLTRAALYAKPGQWSAVQSRDILDLPTLAEYMCLDWQFLEQEGYSDGYSYTYSGGKTIKCVKIGGYSTPDGVENGKHQVRVSLHDKIRFLWNQNIPGEIIPCGLHYLDRARAASYLILGEGASDFATMTFHGIPFLGIPGAEQAKTLDVELIKDIPTIYIIEEPDQAKKLRETGQGFYKNVRQHLRDGGYQGNIFSIRFMKSTGYKDPSDLHKSIYAACKEQAEGPFRQEVQKRFLAALEQAIEQAVPEGNTNLYPVAKARDWSQISFEEFSRQVWSVPPEFLSPIQKMIVCYLFLYMRDVEPDPELGWQIDADKMAPEVGLRGKKGRATFLEHISYLHQKVGILGKEHRAIKEYANDEEGMEQVRYKGKILYVQSVPTFYTPRGYCVVTQDQHKSGGPREKVTPEHMPIGECDYCGSRHLKHYAVQCVDCGNTMYPPVDHDEPLPLEKIIESTLSSQELKSFKMKDLSVEVIELPVERIEKVEECVTLRTNEEKRETDPEYPKLGYSGNEEKNENEPSIDSITVPQIGVFGNSLFPSPVTPVKSIPTPFLENGLPTRMTLCCNVPFQWGATGKPECSNPLCPEKQERIAS